MDWIQDARCKGEATAIFFPKEDEKPQERKQRELIAKSICFECVVKTECLEAGSREEGIWGGLTESERAGRTRKPPLARPIVQESNQISDPTSDSTTTPWIAIDIDGTIQIWQRETSESWHGCEWAVVKNNEIVYRSFNLDDTYAKYGSTRHGSLIHS
jgi:WhiB family transcriptional regulator, redox-sensing transcriptional regulator